MGNRDPKTRVEGAGGQKFKKRGQKRWAILFVLLIAAVVFGIWGYRKYERVSAEVKSGAERLSSVRALMDTPFDQLQAEQVRLAAEDSAAARQDWETAWSEIELLDFPFWWAGKNLPAPLNKAGSIQPLFQTAIHASRLGELVAGGLSPSLQVLAGEQGTKPDGADIAGLVTGLEQGRPKLEQARQELHLLQGSIFQLESSNPPEDIKPLVADLKSSLPELDNYLASAAELPPLLRSLLGMDGPKNYLLISQNNYELRATGGFIGSMGLMTVAGGRISSLDYRSSYSFDSPNRPHVEPPVPYIKYMNATGLYLRDANWWPDFPTSARALEELFYLDQGKRTDGVIAIDMEGVKLLLQFTGPVRVPDYEVEVSADDFLMKSYYYVYSPEWASAKSLEGEDPNELKGKTFLRKLFESVMAKLEETGPARGRELLDTLQRGIAEKHMLLYFNDLELQQYAARSRWDGAVRSARGDYVFLVDSNLSYSDAGLFVGENIRYSVKLGRDGSPQSKAITIRYRNRFNEAEFGSDFGPIGGLIRDPESKQMVVTRAAFGDYVRVYVPEGSSLTAASGFDSTVETYSEAGKTVFAGYLLVLPGQDREISLEYAPPASAAGSATPGSYELLVQKQPGTMSPPIEVRVQVPSGSGITATTPQAEVSGDTVVFRSDLAVDRQFSVKLE